MMRKKILFMLFLSAGLTACASSYYDDDYYPYPLGGMYPPDYGHFPPPPGGHPPPDHGHKPPPPPPGGHKPSPSQGHRPPPPSGGHMQGTRPAVIGGSNLHVPAVRH